MDPKIILNKNHQSIEITQGMFSEHSIIKLEINNSNISKDPQIIWILNNKFLGNPWIKEEILRKFRKYCELNENSSTIYQNLFDASTPGFRGQFITWITWHFLQWKSARDDFLSYVSLKLFCVLLFVSTSSSAYRSRSWWLIFNFSILKMLFHCFLASVYANEKLDIICIFLLYCISVAMSAFKIFFFNLWFSADWAGFI